MLVKNRIVSIDTSAMLLEELDDWTTKVGENGCGIPFLVKKRAFNVFSSNRGSAFAEKVARAYRMVPDRMRFRRCISRLVSRRGYAKVCALILLSQEDALVLLFLSQSCMESARRILLRSKIFVRQRSFPFLS